MSPSVRKDFHPKGLFLSFLLEPNTNFDMETGTLKLKLRQAYDLGLSSSTLLVSNSFAQEIIRV